MDLGELRATVFFLLVQHREAQPDHTVEIGVHTGNLPLAVPFKIGGSDRYDAQVLGNPVVSHAKAADIAADIACMTVSDSDIVTQ